IGPIALFLWLKSSPKSPLLVEDGKPVRPLRPKSWVIRRRRCAECGLAARQAEPAAGPGRGCWCCRWSRRCPGPDSPSRWPAAPTGDVSGAPLQPAPPGGLTGPGWSPEPPSEQAEELATLSGLHAPSARLPFAKAAAVVALGPGQKALARRLLHAAPAGTRGV